MLTQKMLKEVLDYDLETGIFRWKVASAKKVKIGCAAGTVTVQGYIAIKVEGKIRLAHRLAWIYVHGYFPEYQIDHINGIRTDNRWINLRHVSRSCNLQNRCVSSRNTSGFPGVCFNNNIKKWQAYISIHCKLYIIGLHETALDAALARYTVEVQCPQWHCNHRSELTKAIKQVWPEFKPV